MVGQIREYLSPEKKAELSVGYRESVRRNWKNILDGRTLVVDPSSGGSSSLPAVLTLEYGVVTDVREVPVSQKYRRPGYVSHRLREIGKYLREHYGHRTWDLLAVEQIHEIPASNTVMRSYYQLVMSVGAVHASLEAKYTLLIPPWEWRALAPEGYVKSDLGDVSLMGQLLVRDARTYLPSIGGSSE